MLGLQWRLLRGSISCRTTVLPPLQARTELLSMLLSSFLPFLYPAAGESNIYRKPPIYKRHGQSTIWEPGTVALNVGDG